MSDLPIYRQALDAIDHIENDAERRWDAFTSHLPRHRYHDPDAPATPATEAPDMSLITALETDYQDVLAKVEEFAKDKLPAAIADAKKLEGSPVVAALLTAVDGSVPMELLHSMVLPVIDGLVNAYSADTATTAPTAPADPAMGVPPEPVPAVA